jgi:hypothetical protein
VKTSNLTLAKQVSESRSKRFSNTNLRPCIVTVIDKTATNNNNNNNNNNNRSRGSSVTVESE